MEVRAHDFIIKKAYAFDVDTVKNNLFIQDRRLSATGDIHFYQFLYEIPIDHFDSESFSVRKKTTNPETIVLCIKTTGKQNSIITDMFQDNNVSSIPASSGLTLGEWVYSDSLFNELELKVSTLNLYKQ